MLGQFSMSVCINSNQWVCGPNFPCLRPYAHAHTSMCLSYIGIDMWTDSMDNPRRKLVKNKALTQINVCISYEGIHCTGGFVKQKKFVRHFSPAKSEYEPSGAPLESYAVPWCRFQLKIPMELSILNPFV